jgi:hypothetical protein
MWTDDGTKLDIEALSETQMALLTLIGAEKNEAPTAGVSGAGEPGIRHVLVPGSKSVCLANLLYRQGKDFPKTGGEGEKVEGEPELETCALISIFAPHPCLIPPDGWRSCKGFPGAQEDPCQMDAFTQCYLSGLEFALCTTDIPGDILGIEVFFTPATSELMKTKMAYAETTTGLMKEAFMRIAAMTGPPPPPLSKRGEDGDLDLPIKAGPPPPPKPVIVGDAFSFEPPPFLAASPLPGDSGSGH